MRHIAIWGTGFSGSTVLGSVLGSMPGAHFGGEAHWLIDGSKAIYAAKQSVLTTEPTSWAHCRLCGDACEFYTTAFRRELASAPRREMYPRLAQRLGTEVLVTSDKSVGHYRRLSRFDFSAVVSFKEPAEHLLSTQRKRALSQDEKLNSAECISSLDHWVKAYEMFLDTEVKGSKIFVEWLAFYPQGPAAFQRLMSALELEGDANQVLATPRACHVIGGNVRVNLDDLHANRGFQFKPPQEPILTAEMSEAMDGHRAAELLERLRAQAI